MILRYDGTTKVADVASESANSYLVPNYNSMTTFSISDNYTYTVPNDGWVAVYMNISSNQYDSRVKVYPNGSSVTVIAFHNAVQGLQGYNLQNNSTIPVAKGDTLKFEVKNGASAEGRFIPGKLQEVA